MVVVAGVPAIVLTDVALDEFHFERGGIGKLCFHLPVRRKSSRRLPALSKTSFKYHSRFQPGTSSCGAVMKILWRATGEFLKSAASSQPAGRGSKSRCAKMIDVLALAPTPVKTLCGRLTTASKSISPV